MKRKKQGEGGGRGSVYNSVGWEKIRSGILVSIRNPDKNLKPAAILIFLGGHFRQDSP